jgi:hypothetical protein
MREAKFVLFFRALKHALAALTTNGRHFQQAWSRARQHPDRPDQFGSGWEGEWISEENGHRGPLRCVLTRLDSARYEAQFHAVYARVLRVCYSVVLAAQPSGERIRLQGETDLGCLAGGVYQYEGDMDASHLVCRYRCRYDHGTFNLKACQPDEDAERIRFKAVQPV